MNISFLYLPPSSELEVYNLNRMLKKWKCTICGAKGKIWQCSWKANRSGRQHINKNHNGCGNLRILKSN